MLSLLTLSESEQWDSIVKSFEDYDIYYLSGYIKAFEIHEEGEALLIYFNNGTTKAINVVMKIDVSTYSGLVGKIPSNKYYDLITPYGYGGFIVDGDDIEALKSEYEQFCESHNIVSEFVRFHPLLCNCEKVKNLYNITEIGKTVSMDLSSKDLIWDNLSSSKKQNVRKALKSGVECKWGRSKELFDRFKEMYEETMKNLNAGDYYFFGDDFFDSIYHELPDESIIFYAVYDGRIIGMDLQLLSNNKMHRHLVTSDMAYREYYAGSLMVYEAACWGYDNGYENFHLGGGVGCQEDSLYKFKKSFCKTSDSSFRIGKKCYKKEVYNALVEIRKNSDNEFDEKSDFFPLYKA